MMHRFHRRLIPLVVPVICAAMFLAGCVRRAVKVASRDTSR